VHPFPINSLTANTAPTELLALEPRPLPGGILFFMEISNPVLSPIASNIAFTATDATFLTGSLLIADSIILNKFFVKVTSVLEEKKDEQDKINLQQQNNQNKTLISPPFVPKLIQGFPIISNYFTEYNLVAVKYDILWQSEALDSEFQQHFEKFIGKSDFVADQLLDVISQAIDTKDLQFLILLFMLSSFILIRIENERVRLYYLRRILSLFFIMILLSSVLILPFSLSTYYWEGAFAEEPPDYIGPPDSPPADDVSFVQEFGNGKIKTEESKIIIKNKDKIRLR